MQILFTKDSIKRSLNIKKPREKKLTKRNFEKVSFFPDQLLKSEKILSENYSYFSIDNFPGKILLKRRKQFSKFKQFNLS